LTYPPVESLTVRSIMVFKPESSSTVPQIISIGRSPENDIVIDYPMISLKHARIIHGRDGTYIEDLQSRNGTFLNRLETRISRALIKPTDFVFFGSFKVQVKSLLVARKSVIGEAAYRRITLEGDSFSIGRDSHCDLTLNDPTISWRHALIRRAAKGLIVEDLGSRNGTFVDGVRITGRANLSSGQEIGLGAFHFQVLGDGDLAQRGYNSNVTIEARNITASSTDRKQLLEPVSLSIFPSELTALMGPAGAGKTTLLKVLCGYTPPDQGEVLFNGVDLYRFYDRFRQQLGYVPQDDIVHSQLTVGEALYFAARLRTDLFDREISARIDEILGELNIKDKRDSIIGSPEHKVLSGGERKRVNLALELMVDTPIIFLDEPTSGLSSYDAASVIRLLKALSRKGKTIITTIHQPSGEIFREFDDLIMLGKDPGARGTMVYFGPAFPDSITFFNQSNEVKTTVVSGSEMTPEKLLSGLAAKSTAQWLGLYAASPYYQQFVLARASPMSNHEGQGYHPAVRLPDWKQWATLARRNLKIKLRDRAQTVVMLVQAPFFALLIAVMYGHLPTVSAHASFPSIMPKLAGIHFLLVIAAIWFGCNNAVRDIVGEWIVYQRERLVSVKLPSYLFSKIVVLLMVCTLQCVVMLLIVYFLCGLRGSIVSLSAGLLLASVVGVLIGLNVSAQARTTESAIAVLPILLLTIIVLGGGLRPIYMLHKPVRWASYVVPSRWAFELDLSEEVGRTRYSDEPLWGPPQTMPDASVITDPAELTFPQNVAPEENVDDGLTRADVHDPRGVPFRDRPAVCVVVLVMMIGTLILSALLSLRSRDIH
jgi:ABC transport system ATP-binding/permease protein